MDMDQEIQAAQRLASQVNNPSEIMRLATLFITAGRFAEAREAVEQLRDIVRAEAEEFGARQMLEVERLSACLLERAGPMPPCKPGRIFDIAVVDPPWSYDFAATRSRSIEAHYQTMNDVDLKALRLPLADTAGLYLWAVNPRLKLAIELAEAWGFQVVTNIVWDKEVMGIGYHARGQHELVLVCTRGGWRPPAPEFRRSSVIRSRRGRHSAKPEAFQEWLEAAYHDARKLEVFARRRRTGWAAWGNDVGAVARDGPMIVPIPPPEETPNDLVEEGQRLLLPRF